MARQIHNVANMLDAREAGLIPRARADQMYNKFYRDVFSNPGSKQWILENPEMGRMVHEYIEPTDSQLRG